MHLLCFMVDATYFQSNIDVVYVLDIIHTDDKQSHYQYINF